jgi:hypothetical protein
MTFSNGQKARLFDYALVRAGHVQLIACPGRTGERVAWPQSSPGALTFDVNVT